MAVSMDNPSFGGGEDIGCSDFYMPACMHTYEHEYAHATHTHTHTHSIIQNPIRQLVTLFFPSKCLNNIPPGAVEKIEGRFHQGSPTFQYFVTFCLTLFPPLL